MSFGDAAIRALKCGEFPEEPVLVGYSRNCYTLCSVDDDLYGASMDKDYYLCPDGSAEIRLDEGRKLDDAEFGEIFRCESRVTKIPYGMWTLDFSWSAGSSGGVKVRKKITDPSPCP